MEVSEINREVHGTDLLNAVSELAELPNDLVRDELAPWINSEQGNAQSLTLDQLRVVMLNYLESLQEEFSEESESENNAGPNH